MKPLKETLREAVEEFGQLCDVLPTKPQMFSRSGVFPVLLLLTVPLPLVVAPVVSEPMRWFLQLVPNAGRRKSPDASCCCGCGSGES